MNRRAFLAVTAGGLSASSAGIAGAASLADAIAVIGDATFVAIGERHDNAGHHRIQAELVAALQPSGIAFEMIPQAQEEKVNALLEQGAAASEIGAQIGWGDSGWPDWALYAPIIAAAPDAYIAGGGLSKAQLGALYAQGAPGLGPELTARYALDRPLPAELQQEMLDEQYDAHCELIERGKLGRMVAIQRAWDAAYADAWHRAAQRGGGRSVLICGNVHARLDRGAPAALRKVVPGLGIASVGLLEDGDPMPDDTAFTMTLSAEPAEREDPCDRMRKAMEK